MSPPRLTSTAAPVSARGRGGGPVGRERLGGGAEIEPRSLRQLHGAPDGVKPDRPPAGRGERPQGRPIRGMASQVAVVARGHQRGADRRVDEPAGEERGAQRASCIAS